VSSIRTFAMILDAFFVIGDSGLAVEGKSRFLPK
jgi:hypothetical protein